MFTVVGYIKKRIIFRHHYRNTFTPIYKNLGRGRPKEKPASKEIKRET